MGHRSTARVLPFVVPSPVPTDAKLNLLSCPGCRRTTLLASLIPSNAGDHHHYLVLSCLCGEELLFVVDLLPEFPRNPTESYSDWT